MPCGLDRPSRPIARRPPIGPHTAPLCIRGSHRRMVHTGLRLAHDPMTLTRHDPIYSTLTRSPGALSPTLSHSPSPTFSHSLAYPRTLTHSIHPCSLTHSLTHALSLTHSPMLSHSPTHLSLAGLSPSNPRSFNHRSHHPDALTHPRSLTHSSLTLSLSHPLTHALSLKDSINRTRSHLHSSVWPIVPCVPAPPVLCVCVCVCVCVPCRCPPIDWVGS